MGKNMKPILASIYLAELEKFLREKCRKYFEYLVSEFYLLRDSITIDKFSYGYSVEFMDLVIFKSESLKYTGKFAIYIL